MRLSFLYMLGSRAVSLVIMAIGFAVLGRLLPAEAFGHFAVAISLFGLAEVVTQLGLRQLVISTDVPLPRERIAAAAGLSLLIGGVLCALGLTAALLLSGRLLPEPLAAALVPLSITLLVGPFILGTEALLHRSMKFGLISVVEAVKVFVDVIVVISLALLGFGATALALGVCVSHTAVAVALLVFGGPELRVWPRTGKWGEFISWSGRMTAIQILPKAVDLFAISLLSGAQGAAVLGLFNRARTIHQIFDRSLLEGIKPVVLPALSQAMRDGIDPKHVYRLKLDYLTALCWPAFALIALLAEPLVVVLLGSDWDGVVVTVRILALMGLGMPATKMSQKLFVALGETPAYLRLEIVRDSLRVVLSAIGALISLEAFALAYVAGNWIKAVGIAGYLHRRLGPGTGTGRVALRGAALTVATLAGPVVVFLAGLSAVGTLATALPLAIMGWLIAAMAMSHPVAGEIRSLASQTLGRVIVRLN